MRLVLALVTVLCLAPAPKPVALVYAPAAGTTLQRTWRVSYALELEEMSMSFDGEELPAEYMEDMDSTNSREETRIVTDVLEAVADGRATRLVRRFDTLEARDVMTFSGEDDEESESSSPLEGKSVVFSWNDEDEAHEVAYSEGEEGDEEDLDGLEEDMDLRALLPSGEVEPKASWDLAPRVFDSLMALGGDLLEEEEEEEIVGGDELEENLDGTFRATFLELREQDGVRVAVVRLEVDVKTYADEEIAEAGDEEMGEMSGTERTEMAVEAEGELLWDLEHGHALALSLEGTLTMVYAQDMRGTMEGESFEQATSMSFRGPLKLTLEIERP